MSHRDAVTASVPNLLQQTYDRLAGHLKPDTVNAALLLAVEAVLSLTEAREEDFLDPAARCERLREAYLCTRAAAASARFTMAQAEDRCRADGTRTAKEGGS